MAVVEPPPSCVRLFVLLEAEALMIYVDSGIIPDSLSSSLPVELTLTGGRRIVSK